MKGTPRTDALRKKIYDGDGYNVEHSQIKMLLDAHAELEVMLHTARPALAVYAKRDGSEFWNQFVKDLDRALGNPPPFMRSNRSA